MKRDSRIFNVNTHVSRHVHIDPQWCSSSSPFALEEKSAPSAGDTFQ